MFLKWIEHQTCNQGVIGTPPPRKKRKRNKNISPDNEIAQNLLKAVCPFIDFKRMNGKYFVENVIAKKCLSKDQIIEIQGHLLCKLDKELKEKNKPKRVGVFRIQRKVRAIPF